MIEKAIIYATMQHEGQLRKLVETPYIYHPLEVMLIVRKLTDDEEVIAAAVLHDVVEDTSATIEDIRTRFGDRVAFLVACETENKREGQSAESTWHIRKMETIEHLNSLPLEAKMITLGDKLSNLRSIYLSYLDQGDAIFNSFHNHNKADHAWYYRSLLERMPELAGTEAYKACQVYVEKIFGGDGKL